MPAISDKVVKMFQVSKYTLYVDGDPTPYVASVTLPNIVSESIEFNNTSTGGMVEFADAFRKRVDGEGELTLENDSSLSVPFLIDSTRTRTVKISAAVNGYNPQLGVVAPIPIKYTMTCQFSGYNPGEIALGQKREVTATFKIFTLKLEIAGNEIFDYDFINGTFSVEGVDLLTALVGVI